VALQGCYRDNPGSRDLPVEMTGFSLSMTPARCIQFCRDAGYIYAGLQVGVATPLFLFIYLLIYLCFIDSLVYKGHKGAWACPATAQICWVPPIIAGTNFKFCMHIHSISRKKSPLKISGKVAVGVVRDSRNFSGQSCVGRIAQSSLR